MNENRLHLPDPKRMAALIVVILAGALISLNACTPSLPGTGGNTPMPDTSQPATGKPAENYGVDVGVSQGQAQAQTPVPQPVATGEPLTPQEIEAIFERLPDLPVSPNEQTSFKYPVQLLPPPRPGTTITETFPAVEPAPTPAVELPGPLEVLRHAPEGEIPIAPFVSITFNQPMVALGTLGDLAAEGVPAKIEPSLPGTWRWLGTKTLTFEYDSKLVDRLPKATEYTVSIPAGTRSASGGVLAQTVTWKFATPAPVVTAMYPQNVPQPLDPLIFVAFDQRIEPAAVLKTIQVFAGNERVELILASQPEIEKDEQVSQYVKNAQAGRWLVFRSPQPFTADTAISVTIGPGTPSAEGPRVTTTAQSFGFSTYAPLRVVEHGCYWGGSNCPPLTPFSIRFNNPLDSDAFTQELLRVSPEIPGMQFNIYNDTLVISGETRGQTTYTVTLSAAIKDIFAQTLGSDKKLTFKVGKAEPRLTGPDQVFLTLDPAAKKPVFSVYAINYSKLHVKVYSVQPADWPAFAKYMREWRQTDQPGRMPGELVYDKVMPLDIPADTLSEVNIELSPYLKNGFGHFVVVVEPPQGMFETENEKWQRYSQSIQAWVQVTQIGVDAYTDATDMIVWATGLKDGKPLAGVSIQPNQGGRTIATGKDGTLRFAIPSGATYLVASQGADRAMLLHSPYYWDDNGWTAGTSSNSLRWYVFDDRQMYRPGEEVHIKGWMRRLGARQNGDVSLVGGEVTSVSYQLTDPQGNSIGSGQADVNALGGFDFAFTIPQTVNLGTAALNLNAQGSLGGLDGSSYGHSIQIQEFRRPEYEVTASNQTTGPYFAGGRRGPGRAGKVLCRRRAAECRCHLGGQNLAGQLFPAKLARFCLWRMAPLVGF